MRKFSFTATRRRKTKFPTVYPTIYLPKWKLCKFSFGEVYCRIYGWKFSFTAMRKFSFTATRCRKTKFPTVYPTIYLPKWKFAQASFPTGTVGPLVGIFLSPLNTNDGFYLSPKLSTMSRHYMWLHMLAAVTHVRLNIYMMFTNINNN